MGFYRVFIPVSLAAVVPAPVSLASVAPAALVVDSGLAGSS
jgi:hypothetical protein